MGYGLNLNMEPTSKENRLDTEVLQQVSQTKTRSWIRIIRRGKGKREKVEVRRRSESTVRFVIECARLMISSEGLKTTQRQR
jgi:hypothetical protein